MEGGDTTDTVVFRLDCMATEAPPVGERAAARAEAEADELAASWPYPDTVTGTVAAASALRCSAASTRRLETVAEPMETLVLLTLS